MQRISRWIVQHPKVWIAAWLLALAAALPLAPRLGPQLKGGGDAVAGTLSAVAADRLQQQFGKGSAYVIPVVLQAPGAGAQKGALAADTLALAQALARAGGVRSVLHAWNSGMPALVGKDQASALLLATPDADSFSNTEKVVMNLRQAASTAKLPAGCVVRVTGAVASFHDLNRGSSEDLLRAERWGIPLTLLILALVFGTPLSAALPLLLALAASVIGTAGLYLLSPYLDVTVFAQNAITMIGLGVGVDYALIILSRFRDESLRGLSPQAAAEETLRHAGVSVIFSGLTVALGFAALLLVPVPFLHAIALGGVMVVAVAVAASVTLLPGLLALAGPRLDWPRKQRGPSAWRLRLRSGWATWSGWVMRHPWRVLLPSLLVLACLILPASHMKTIGMGAHDLDPAMEARQGSEVLAAQFSEGWMGPLVLLAEAQPGHDVLDAPSRAAILGLSTQLAQDPRVDRVLGFPSLAQALAAGVPPAALAQAAGLAVSPDHRTALILVLPKAGPESQAARGLLANLRQKHWPGLNAAGLSLAITGVPALLQDFDDTLLGSLKTLIPLVLLATFVALAILFRSLLIPLKAVLLNLASVLAAYGFLVLLFQDGVLAASLGLQAVGGLNSFIVVMLFTILFGLSMDYEVFLLMAIREEHWQGVSDGQAVATGLAKTAGLISSAALIMVCLFSSFALTRLAATKTFGLGLAFAVGLDATLVRLALVPALMELFGAANWWFPGLQKRADAKAKP
jgi:RND superfamily putative drug exporter